MSWDDDEDFDGDREVSPPRLQFEPGQPASITLGTLGDGSPVLRVGIERGIALDFDHPVPLPPAAIGWVQTQRGVHVLFAPTVTGRAAADAMEGVDVSHHRASMECGSWDLRVRDKGTLAPRILHKHGQARVVGTPEETAFAAIAAVWTQGGGLVQRSLQEWLDAESYILHSLEVGTEAARVFVDKVPSQWFAPQWVPVPSDVYIEPSRLMTPGGSNSIYEGRFTPNGTEVTADGMPLPLRLDLAQHSTDFAWGNGSAGSAQLALALLAHALGDDVLALKVYRDFQWGVLAHLPRRAPWRLCASPIRVYAAAVVASEKAEYAEATLEERRRLSSAMILDAQPVLSAVPQGGAAEGG